MSESKTVVEIMMKIARGQSQDNAILKVEFVFPKFLADNVGPKFEQGIDILVKAIINSIKGNVVYTDKVNFSGEEAGTAQEISVEDFFSSKRGKVN